jgi:imidazolonepropionase-like amidohydrolase
MLTAIRIAKEYDIEITLDHATDSQAILDQIKESGFPCICGPSLCHKDKFECANDSFETPNKMYEKGILFAITTDSPFNPQQYLPLNAALAHKAGLPELEAIKAITINPAKILHLENRVGSIKPGKDADFVLLGDDYQVLATYVAGRRVYDRSESALLRSEFLTERLFTPA